MENAALLQSITHLTRLINERQKFNAYPSKFPNTTTRPHWNSKFNYNKANISYSNYKYVKSKSNEQVATPIKAHVKLNVEPVSVPTPIPRLPLSNKVLINPRFPRASTNVYINPNFKPPKPNVYVNPKILSEKTIENINIVQKKTVIPPKVQNSTSLKTISQYKIVRSTPKTVSIVTPLRKISPQSKYLVKTKFKLDRRISKVIRKRKVSIKSDPNHKNTRLVNIDGTFYNTSRNKLQKTGTFSSPDKNRRFRFVRETEVKQCVPARIRKISVQTPIRVRKISVQSRKVNSSKKVIVKSRFKVVNKTKKDTPERSRFKLVNKSKITRKSPKKVSSMYRKNNVPCPFYVRSGKCSSHDKGICRRLHDPKLISICKKFLQGDCHNESCLMSHNVSLEKMPACKFFLNGFCSKENCQYLHVKLNDNVPICRDFLNGFCVAADKCNKRHIYMCPEMDRHGKCSKPKCSYPHPTVGKKNFNLPKPVPQINPSVNIVSPGDEIAGCDRYFIKDTDVSNANEGITIQYFVKSDPVSSCESKVETCPDFIPFTK